MSIDDSYHVHDAVCFDATQKYAFLWDDFLGDQLQDEWNTSGSAGTTFTVVDGVTGGIFRITTDGDDDDNGYLDWGNIRSLLVGQRITIEFRVDLSASTNIWAIMGLYDDANDNVYFEFDSDSDTNWMLHSEAAGTPTDADGGTAPDTDNHYYRIAGHTHGGNHWHFYIDGIEQSNSPVSTNVSAVAMQPYVFLQAREAAAKNLDVDYIYLKQDRG